MRVQTCIPHDHSPWAESSRTGHAKGSVWGRFHVQSSRAMCTGRKEEHVPSGIFLNDTRPPGFQVGVSCSRCQPGGGGASHPGSLTGGEGAGMH